MIYFTRYKSIKILRLHYEKLIGKIKEHERKKYFIVDDYMLDRVLDKIKKISLKKFDDTKILIDMDDKLPNSIIVILTTCFM